MRRLVLLFSCAALAAASVFSAPAQEAEQRSVQVGVYSEEQAARGEQLFTETCMVCHQPEEFSEGSYLEGWAGQSAGDLLELIRTTMPEDNPGRLKRREYVDVITYLFKINGLPAGSEQLSSEDMKSILIEGPFGSGSSGSSGTGSKSSESSEK